MTHRYQLILLFVLACTCVRAQTYVAVEAQETRTASEVTQGLVPNAPYDVQNYKITYNTIDAAGEPTVASGMMSLPADTTLKFPITIYMHGTVTDREAVPSRIGTAERGIVDILASSGYIGLAPDYIGLGDNEGFHPYVHAASEASAGRDLILAAKQYLTEQGRAFNDQLFITGYSQGGHAAQALHRDIQENRTADSLRVTAGAHLSGPYSISGVMRRAALQEEMATQPGFIIYTYVSYNNVYGIYDNLGEAFKEPYLSAIQRYNNEEIDGSAFNSELANLLEDNEERLIDMFQDSIRQQIENNDDDSRIVQALRDNDTYEWAPTAPTLLFYCTSDEQVPFENAILADSVMRALGSTSVRAQSGGPLTHGGCVLPATFSALTLFNSLANRPLISSVGRAVSLPGLRVYPNPLAATGALVIDGLPNGADYRYTLYNISGQEVQRGQLREGKPLQFDRTRQVGAYLLRINLPDGNYVARRVMLR